MTDQIERYGFCGKDCHSCPKYNDKKEKIRQGYSDGSHSEIEVSGYDFWNSDTILDRGTKLLEFMEQRWDLKFEDETAKAELLFLDFMLQEEEPQSREE
mgnify:CR=1 FL=1